MPKYVTLYLDESGEKTWPAPWGASAHKFYVLAGPVLTPEQDRTAHTGVRSILTECFPDEDHRPKELHYSDLINKREPYDRLSDQKREALADRVWGLIFELSPVLIGTVVNKEIMKARYSGAAHPPNEYAMRATIERFDRHLEETGCLGMAIMDTESLEADRALRTMVHRAREVGIKLFGIGYMPQSDRRLEFVLNSVTFTPSEMSPGIQLADYIAYATFSHFEREKSRRYSALEHLWRRHGSFREPSVIPRPR